MSDIDPKSHDFGYEAHMPDTAAELLQLNRWDLYEVMGRYKVPAIDLTPEELQQELTKVLKPQQPV